MRRLSAIEAAPVFAASRALVLHSHLSAEQYMTLCDQIWSTDKRSSKKTEKRTPRHGSVVYAKRDHAPQFADCLRKTRLRLVLVTAESDDILSIDEPFPPNVASWFSTNSLHPRVQSIPLGLGNSYCTTTVKAPVLADVTEHPKDALLYINFRPWTNAPVRQPLWDSYTKAADEGWATRRPGDTGGIDYARDLARHHFVLCPPGNGVDTHRIWETLYAGSVPIVQRHPALRTFEDLPILFVDKLEALDKTFLEQALVKMRERGNWSLEKLLLPHWRSRISAAKTDITAKLSFLDFMRSLRTLSRNSMRLNKR